MGFEAGWLTSRAPFDAAPLDHQAAAIIKDWGTTAPAGRARLARGELGLRVRHVDLLAHRPLVGATS